MQAQQITKQREDSISHHQPFQQKLSLSHRQVSVKQDALCKEVIYENRIFHVKRKYVLPKEISEIKNIKDRLKTQDIQLIKLRPAKEFCSYIDNLQRNRALLRRGACQIPIQPWFSKNRIKCKIKTQESQNQYEIAKEREKIYTVVSSTKALNNQNRIKQSFSRHRYSTPNANLSPQTHLISNSQKQSIIPNVQRFVSQTFRKKQLSDKEESIRRRNSIYRKLSIQIIKYQLLGRLSQS